MSKTIAVIFDGPPVIGDRYNLSTLIGAGEEGEATLINLAPQEKTIRLPSGQRETYHELFAIFEADDGRKFKRVVMPDVAQVVL